jgi:hypothetical protein
MSAGASILLKTPDEIPYRIEMRIKPGAVFAPKKQKQRIALIRDMMMRRFRGP